MIYFKHLKDYVGYMVECVWIIMVLKSIEKIKKYI